MATAEQDRVLKMFESVDYIAAKYGEIDPGDFVLKEMLETLASVKRCASIAQERAERCAPREDKDSSDEYLRQMAMASRFQKQQVDLLTKIAKHQETMFHKTRKTKGKNKSAAPGQQVGITTFKPQESKCANQN